MLLEDLEQMYPWIPQEILAAFTGLPATDQTAAVLEELDQTYCELAYQEYKGGEE